MSVLSLPKRLATVVAVFGLFGVGTAGAATAVALKPDQQPDFARVIVRFKAQADAVKARPLAVRATASEAKDIAQVRGTTLGLRHAATLHARRSLDSRTHVYTASGMSSAELAKRLAADSDVESVEVDRWQKHFSVPNDPLYATAAANGVTAGQWYLKAPDSTVLSSINAPAAWDKSTGTGVVVAVLDTGARMDHPDLAGQFVQGYDMIGFGNSGTSVIATANDGDGADSDPSDPGDWVSQSDIDSGRLGSSCTADDIGNSSWHGTRVSGLIAAITNNNQGMAGLAYGAKILPVRVLGKCGGWASDIAAGMRWAAGITVPGLPTNNFPAKVINMSLGGDGACSSTYQDAITAAVSAGATVVAAAGNGVENDDPTKEGGINVGTPANCNNVIAVAGLRHSGTKVGFSNLGPQVTISAPGGNCVNSTGACLYPILSTTNSGTTTPVAGSAAFNYTGTGTSFSTPLVSATVALMLQVDPTLTPAKIKTALQSSARAFPTATAGVAQCVAGNSAQPQLECNCTTSTCGAGMLDANAAVLAVTPAATPPSTPASTPTTTDTPSSGGGGGGAMSGLWLAALVLAIVALRWPKPRLAKIRSK
ncbi:S8 family peptidase [Mitsuaria sp. 7]|uniref:S8 family peptidase n=1 Tax=Mitsuaria sp. 7 TaxID=1658665 RepID=UPI00083021B5|nr:S8 family peptidase [Mitsuaria sp. 7]